MFWLNNNESPILTWKYWFSCTRLSLDRILLMVIRLLLIPPKPVGVRGQGRFGLRHAGFWANCQEEGDGAGNRRGPGGLSQGTRGTL